MITLTLTVSIEKLDLILQHPDIQQLQQQMSTLSKNLPAMPDYSIYVKKVKSAIKKVDMRKPYNEVVTKVTSVLQTKYDELQKDQDFVLFQTLVKEIYEEV
jgi:vacuolar-type H+-ATPase subunit E/Vma4